MRLLPVLLALASVAALLVFLGLAALRVAYPFELEWMEGGMLEHVQRVLRGEALYGAPSLEFMAYPYTPLYAHVSALVARALGADFFALRLVSSVSAIACFGLLFRIVRRDSGSPWAGLIAAGLFAAAYDFTGSWLDVARVDSLALALALGGVALAQLRDGSGQRGARAFPAWAGLVFGLAFLAKQSAAGPAAGVLLALALRSRRAALRFALGCGVVVLGSTVWLERATDGWYRWHVFELMAGHPLYRPHILGFWRELAANLGPAFAIALWVRLRRGPVGPDAARGWDPLLVIVAASLVLTAWVGRMHVGGYDNTLLPAALAAALVLGAALGRLRLASASRSPEGSSGRSSGRHELVLVAALVQFALLAFDPRAKVPTDADRAAGERIVAELSEVSSANGALWVPYHGYLATRAGGRAGAHAMPILDLLQGDDRETASAFLQQLVAALAEKRWQLIVLDDLSWEQDLPPLREHYARTRVLLDPGRPVPFRPVTGEALRPVYVYEPR